MQCKTQQDKVSFICPETAPQPARWELFWGPIYSHPSDPVCVCVSMWVVLTVNILLFRIWFCGTWNRLQGDDRRRSSQETAAFPGASYTHCLNSAESHRNRASPPLSLHCLQDRAGHANRTSKRPKRKKLQQWKHSVYVWISRLLSSSSWQRWVCSICTDSWKLIRKNIMLSWVIHHEHYCVGKAALKLLRVKLQATHYVKQLH